MPHIRIVGPSASRPGQPLAAHGSLVYLDGVEVRELCDFSVHFPVDGAVRLEMTVLATESVTWEGAADVHVTVLPVPGYRIVEERRPDGTTVYRTEPEP